MKAKMIFAAALAVAMFASCAKDNESKVPGRSNGKEAKLNIAIGNTTRAIGNASTEDATITHYTAFIVYANGDVQVEPCPTDDALTDIDVTTSAEYVYIVANHTGITTEFDDIDTKAELDAFMLDLTATIGSQSTARWATGVSDKLNFVQSGTDFVANPDPIVLNFVAARIVVEIVNDMTGYDPANTDGDLVLENVAVLNAGGTSKLFGTSLYPSTMKYYSGIDNSSSGFSHWPAVANYSVESSMINAIPADPESTKFYYYVFENGATTANAFPTIVTLIGEFDGKKVYYPVHLAPYEQFLAGGTTTATSVVRGKSYNIVITLSVDPTKPGGTTDPTNPIIDATVNVSVTLNDWDPVNLGKQFE